MKENITGKVQWAGELGNKGISYSQIASFKPTTWGWLGGPHRTL